MREIVFQKNNKVEWMDSRFYILPNGQYVPSVTTVLTAYPRTPAFFEWLKKVGDNADDIRDDAGESGSKVHQAIELYDKDIEVCWVDEFGKPYYSILEWQMIDRYVQFAEKTKYKLVSNEVNYASDKLRVGGTLDKVCEINGVRWLIDNKTSNYIYDNFWLQLVAYKMLWEEFNPDYPIQKLGILHLKAQTRTEGKGDAIQGRGWKLCEPEKNIEYYWELFQATYLLWSAQNPSCAPLNKVYPSSFKKDSKK